MAMGALDMLARIYWYTVEFGLIDEGRGLRAYGAGIVSSATETVYSCLLYTSDAADDLLCVDIGGRSIINKTKIPYNLSNKTIVPLIYRHT